MKKFLKIILKILTSIVVTPFALAFGIMTWGGSLLLILLEVLIDSYYYIWHQ